MRTLFAVLLCTLLLAGCGQKGPLTLPQDDAPAPQQGE
jgi:predicted small lipoprotein YifL